MALHDLAAHLHRRLEGREHIGRGAVQQHLDKHHHAATQFERVQARLVTQDVAALGKPLHARQYGGRGERHALGQLEVGDAPVLLQAVHDLEVDTVEGGYVIAHDVR